MQELIHATINSGKNTDLGETISVFAQAYLTHSTETVGLVTIYNEKVLPYFGTKIKYNNISELGRCDISDDTVIMFANHLKDMLIAAANIDLYNRVDKYYTSIVNNILKQVSNNTCGMAIDSFIADISDLAKYLKDKFPKIHDIVIGYLNHMVAHSINTVSLTDDTRCLSSINISNHHDAINLFSISTVKLGMVISRNSKLYASLRLSNITRAIEVGTVAHNMLSQILSSTYTLGLHRYISIYSVDDSTGAITDVFRLIYKDDGSFVNIR